MNERPTILVLMGGPDAEREVSLMSGRAVAEALRQSNRFHVADSIIDKPDYEELRALAQDVHADVIFPVLHGTWGEGGSLQELLESIAIPYVGCRPHAARLAMDKLITKSMVASAGVATPLAHQLMPDEGECDLDPPLVLKPIDDGSSVDMRICRTRAEVEAARRLLHPKRGRLLAERYVRGRELTVGIIAGKALPLIEIIPAPAVAFYDYEAKYMRDDTRYIVSPELPEPIAERCREWALVAFRRLNCRDIARVDFMLDDDGPWFLEINTMPGFTSHSLVPKAAEAIGIAMPELCAGLAQVALDRSQLVPGDENASIVSAFEALGR